MNGPGFCSVANALARAKSMADAAQPGQAWKTRARVPRRGPTRRAQSPPHSWQAGRLLTVTIGKSNAALVSFAMFPPCAGPYTRPVAPVGTLQAICRGEGERPRGGLQAPGAR